MERFALSIYRSFFAVTLCLLAMVLPFSAFYSRTSCLGVAIGWAGIQIYIYLLHRAMGRLMGEETEYTGTPYRRTKFSPERLVFFRLIILFFFLIVTAGKGRSVFFWSIGMALLVYFIWLLYLVYWFYKRT